MFLLLANISKKHIYDEETNFTSRLYPKAAFRAWLDFMMSNDSGQLTPGNLNFRAMQHVVPQNNIVFHNK